MRDGGGEDEERGSVDSGCRGAVERSGAIGGVMVFATKDTLSSRLARVSCATAAVFFFPPFLPLAHLSKMSE